MFFWGGVGRSLDGHELYNLDGKIQIQKGAFFKRHIQHHHSAINDQLHFTPILTRVWVFLLIFGDHMIIKHDNQVLSYISMWRCGFSSAKLMIVIC